MSSVSKILQFAKMNDHPVVLCSENSDEDFVIMSLDKYRQLEQTIQKDNGNTKKETSNLTKEEILRKINKDIELWRRKLQENQHNKNIKQLEQELKDMKRLRNNQSNYHNLEEVNYNYLSSHDKSNNPSQNSNLTGKRDIPPR